MLELCRSYVESYVKMSYRGSGTVRSYFGGSPFTNAPVHEPFTNRSFIFRRAVPPRSRTGPFTNRSRTVRSYFGGLYPTRSRTGPFTNRSRTVRSNFPLHERTTLTNKGVSLTTKTVKCKVHSILHTTVELTTKKGASHPRFFEKHICNGAYAVCSSSSPCLPCSSPRQPHCTRLGTQPDHTKGILETAAHQR